MGHHSIADASWAHLRKHDLPHDRRTRADAPGPDGSEPNRARLVRFLLGVDGHLGHNHRGHASFTSLAPTDQPARAEPRPGHGRRGIFWPCADPEDIRISRLHAILLQRTPQAYQARVLKIVERGRAWPKGHLPRRRTLIPISARSDSSKTKTSTWALSKTIRKAEFGKASSPRQYSFSFEEFFALFK